MSSDDPEIIPPNKNAVVTRTEHGTGPVRYENAPSGHLGVIGSTLTGWRAEVEARAYGAIAERIRAQRRVLDAETERRKSALALLRVTGMLEEAPDILALDRAHRIAERAEKYAAIELNLNMARSSTIATSWDINGTSPSSVAKEKSRRRTLGWWTRSATDLPPNRNWKMNNGSGNSTWRVCRSVQRRNIWKRCLRLSHGMMRRPTRSEPTALLGLLRSFGGCASHC
jgi:hypothetical protein